MPLDIRPFSQKPLDLKACFSALIAETQEIIAIQERGLYFNGVPSHLLLAFCYGIHEKNDEELKRLWSVVKQHALKQEEGDCPAQNQRLHAFYHHISELFPQVLAQRQDPSTRSELRQLLTAAHDLCYENPLADANEWQNAHNKVSFKPEGNGLYNRALMLLTKAYLDYFIHPSNTHLYRALYTNPECWKLVKAAESNHKSYAAWYKFENAQGFTAEEQEIVNQGAELEVLAEQADGENEAYCGFGSLSMHYRVYLACIHNNPSRAHAYTQAYPKYAELIKLLMYFDVAPFPNGTRIDKNGYVESIPGIPNFTKLSTDQKLKYDLQATLIRLDNQRSQIDDNFMSEAKTACQAQGLSPEVWRAAISRIERQDLSKLELPEALEAWARKHAPQQPTSHSASSSSAAAFALARKTTKKRPREEDLNPWGSSDEDTDHDDASSTKAVVREPKMARTAAASSPVHPQANGASIDAARLLGLEAQLALANGQLQTLSARNLTLEAQVQALQQQQQLLLAIAIQMSQLMFGAAAGNPAQVPGGDPRLFQIMAPAAANGVAPAANP